MMAAIQVQLRAFLLRLSGYRPQRRVYAVGFNVFLKQLFFWRQSTSGKRLPDKVCCGPTLTCDFFICFSHWLVIIRRQSALSGEDWHCYWRYALFENNDSAMALNTIQA